MARLDFHNFLPLVPPSPQRGSPLEQRGGGWQLWGGSKLPAEGPLEQRGGGWQLWGGAKLPGNPARGQVVPDGVEKGPLGTKPNTLPSHRAQTTESEVAKNSFHLFHPGGHRGTTNSSERLHERIATPPYLSASLSASLSLSLSLCLCLSFPVAVYGYAYVGANADVFVDDSPHADADPDA